MRLSLFPKSQCAFLSRNSLYIDNDPLPPTTPASYELVQMILVSTIGARDVQLTSCESMTSQDALDAWQAAYKPLEPPPPRKVGSPGGTQEHVTDVHSRRTSGCHSSPPRPWSASQTFQLHVEKPRAIHLAAIRGRVFLRACTSKQRLICHKKVVRCQCVCLFSELSVPSDSVVPGSFSIVDSFCVTRDQLDAWPQKQMPCQ